MSRKLKILYSHDIFSMQFVGGISRYIFELFSRNKNAKIPLLYSENLYLNKHKKTAHFRGKTRIISLLNEMSEKLLSKNTFDIYHISYYKKSPNIPSDAVFIVSVYDMIHEIYAKSYFKNDNKTSALKRQNCLQCDGIIAISQTTKNDLIRFFGIDEHKIRVIYLGHSLQKPPILRKNSQNLPKNYILFVGSRGAYKNFTNFACAFVEILHIHPQIKALCVGEKFSDDECKFLETLKIKNAFIALQAKENELYEIYAQAKCFVFPSFYEGFGIPILESFFAGCPAVLSDIAVFREIASDAAMYFNPHDKTSIAQTILQIMRDTSLAQEKVALGKERLKHFSWDETYRQTMKFYNEVINAKFAESTLNSTNPQNLGKNHIKNAESSGKIALIIGAGGQDGYFLMKLLLQKGYIVHIIVRKVPKYDDFSFIHYDDLYFNNIDGKVIYHYGDVTDSSSIVDIFSKVKPNEIYNLAGISNVKISFSLPQRTADSIALGTLRILDAIKMLNLTVRFYNACSSEIFGSSTGKLNENSPFDPKSPYAIAKLYAFYMVRHYREAYGIFAVNGILFNHESELRGEEFVSKKIIKSALKIANNLQEKLYLGNLDAKRDFGYAKDYVECMFLMLQHNMAEDFIIATGAQKSIREFCEIAFRKVGIELEFIGTGIDEKGIDKASKKVIIEVNPNYFRPLDIKSSLGDSTKARQKLGWNPKKTTFEAMIEIMLKYEAKLLKIAESAKITNGGGQNELIIIVDSATQIKLAKSTQKHLRCA